MLNILWLQGGCCGGETVSLLNSEQPGFLTLLNEFDLNLLWHPSLSPQDGTKILNLFAKLLTEKVKLDILVVEGAIYNGPAGTGKYDWFCGRSFREWVIDLSKVSEYTLAVGTCSSFGGIPAAGKNLMEATGLQFFREKKGGLLGEDYLSRGGLPVINISGCPAHPDWIVESLINLIRGEFQLDDLDRFHRPRIFYEKLAHHACPRNEYYEFKASAESYSQQGCLFENLGCKGTQCESDCNERLWLVRTGSCTRGGFPCISCTSPRFPDGFVPFFETEKIGNIPTTLPLDVPKAWYVGISGLAKLACPERLLVNATSFKPVKIAQENREKWRKS